MISFGMGNMESSSLISTYIHFVHSFLYNKKLYIYGIELTITEIIPVTIPKKIINDEEAINNNELPINIFLLDF